MNKFGLFQKQLGALEGIVTPEDSAVFFAHLSLESVFPVLNLTQSCYMNMNVSFSYKLAI